MTTAASAGPRELGESLKPPPGRARSLMGAVVVYALVLLLITLLFPADSGFTSDDGAYAGQVQALRNGTWALEREPPVVPAEFEGWINSRVTPDGPIPYGWHPVHVHALRLATFGGRYPLGLQIPSVLSAVAAAALAWLTIERFRPGAGPIAFWLLALGPPIVNATAVWAHNVGTAMAALALFGIVSRGGPRGRSHLVATAAVLATTIGPLFRTEVALWAVALAPAVWVSPWLRHRRLLVTVMAAAAMTSALMERLWTAGIYEHQLFSTSVATEPPSAAVRIVAMAATLVWPSDLGQRASWVVGVVTVVVLGAGVWFLRHGRSGDIGSVLLAAGGLSYAVRVVLAPLDRVKGLLLAWPAMACSLFLDGGHLTEGERRFSRFATLAVGLYTAGVFATQHPHGAGLEWGGRYLACAYGALAVVAGLRLRPVWERRRSFVAMTMLGPAALGLAVSYNTHVFNLRSMEDVRHHDVDVVVSSNPAAVRTSWSALPQPWFTADEHNLNRLLDILAESDKERVALNGFDHRNIAVEPHYRVVTVDDRVIVLEAD